MTYWRGVITISVLTGIAAFLIAFAAPIMYVGGIKEVNAVQDVKIKTLEENHRELRADNKLLSNKLDMLLIRAGVDPLKITAR